MVLMPYARRCTMGFRCQPKESVLARTCIHWCGCVACKLTGQDPNEYPTVELAGGNLAW